MTSRSEEDRGPETIAAAAHAARIAISDSDAKALAHDLSSVFSMLGGLPFHASIQGPTGPASSAESLYLQAPEYLHAHAAAPREDVPAPSLSTDDALRNAPERDGTYLRVPPVF